MDGKPTIVIAGDSIAKDVKGWLMSRDKRVIVFQEQYRRHGRLFYIDYTKKTE